MTPSAEASTTDLTDLAGKLAGANACWARAQAEADELRGKLDGANAAWRRAAGSAPDGVAGPFALYVRDVCWGDGYATLDAALADAWSAKCGDGRLPGEAERDIRIVAVPAVTPPQPTFDAVFSQASQMWGTDWPASSLKTYAERYGWARAALIGGATT
jgi:hypothetical protein